MPGFFVSSHPDPPTLRNEYDERCVRGAIANDRFTIARNTLDKFSSDRAFLDSPTHVVVTEGAILNSAKLCNESGTEDIGEHLLSRIRSGDHAPWSSMRGSFSGAILEKRTSTWHFFTNHIGDKPLFFYSNGTDFIVGSQLNYVSEALRELGVDSSVDEQACYSLLTYGFLPDSHTVISQIRRLLPGQAMTIAANGNVSIWEYHRFRNDRFDVSGETPRSLVHELNEHFTRATRAQFEKDREHNYHHLADISGGLDSRMVNWVAARSGFSPIQNITYSQSGYQELDIAAEVSGALGNRLLIRTLDDAGFLDESDQIVRMNNGSALYSGITGGKQMLDSINLTTLGIEHTGQLGDVVVGSFIKPGDDSEGTKIDGLYSNRLKDRLPNDLPGSFDSQELYLMYTRGFLGALSTHAIRQNYTETLSPFCDVELMDFCLSIPTSQRMDHALYRLWISECHPGAGAFKWEKINSKISDHNLRILWNRGRRKIQRELSQRLYPKNTRHDLGTTMNPFSYWHESLPHVRESLTMQFRYRIGDLPLSPALHNDLTMMFDLGTAQEKTMAVTVVAALRQFVLFDPSASTSTAG